MTRARLDLLAALAVSCLVGLVPAGCGGGATSGVDDVVLDGDAATMPGAPDAPQAPRLTAFAPTAVPSEVPTDFVLTGTGFGPVAAAVTVRFEAPDGTPFAGGVAPAVEMEAVIWSTTEIRGTSCPCGLPDDAGDVPCAVTVLLPGAETPLGPAEAVITRPLLTAVTPAVLSGVGTTFVLEGTGFGPEAQVWMVEFTAVARTPFRGRTSATFVAPASVVSPTMLLGSLPPGAQVTESTVASVVAVCPSGARVASDGPIVVFEPEP